MNQERTEAVIGQSPSASTATPLFVPTLGLSQQWQRRRTVWRDKPCTVRGCCDADGSSSSQEISANQRPPAQASSLTVHRLCTLASLPACKCLPEPRACHCCLIARFNRPLESSAPQRDCPFPCTSFSSPLCLCLRRMPSATTIACFHAAQPELFPRPLPLVLQNKTLEDD